MSEQREGKSQQCPKTKSLMVALMGCARFSRKRTVLNSVKLEGSSDFTDTYIFFPTIDLSHSDGPDELKARQTPANTKETGFMHLRNWVQNPVRLLLSDITMSCLLFHLKCICTWRLKTQTE